MHESVTVNTLFRELLRVIYNSSPKACRERVTISKYSSGHHYYSIFPITGAQLHEMTLSQISNNIIANVVFYPVCWQIPKERAYWSRVESFKGTTLKVAIVGDNQQDVNWLICEVIFD